jgi:hypothetical protein
VAAARAEQELPQVAAGDTVFDVAFGAGSHRAELVEGEQPAVEADALLLEQGGAGAVEPDQGQGEQPDGRQYGQHQAGPH